MCINCEFNRVCHMHQKLDVFLAETDKYAFMHYSKKTSIKEYFQTQCRVFKERGK